MSRRLARRLARVESRNITYASRDFPVFWESARGAYVRDADGQRFLDLSSAFGVCSLGHNPPVVLKALQKQAKRMWHGMGDIHPNAVKVELLELLAKLAPGKLGVSILSTTGSEAIESALKTARLYTGRPGVLAFEGGYHGLTYGSLATTHRRDFREPFAGQWANFVTHVRYPDPFHHWKEEYALEAVEKVLREGSPKGPVGALLVEAAQGRGGVRIGSRAFMRGLRELTQRFGVLMIVDEVFTGFGRTGKRFAVDHSGITPDLLCVGKAMANGYPISACIGSAELMETWPASDGEAIHTSTFLGNPLGCAMALATLKELEKTKWAGRAAATGDWWKDQLSRALGDHPRVGDIRGLGLMIGIELVKDRESNEPDAAYAARVVTQALAEGLILLSGGNHRNVITLTPPLMTPREDLGRATALLKEVFRAAA